MQVLAVLLESQLAEIKHISTIAYTTQNRSLHNQDLT